MSAILEVASAAAALVADEGMEYAAAKKKAARALGHRGELPSNEQLEDAVREHLAVFHADTQPAELRALRELALRWMERRLAQFRPHLGGAAWRGTATKQSALMIDLYCDDPKSAEIALLDGRIDFDVASQDRPGQPPLDVLTVADRIPGWPEPVTLHLLVRDLDELRGALQPDARGRTWRGDAAALARRLAEDGEP
jgi:hypothetical protein